VNVEVNAAFVKSKDSFLYAVCLGGGRIVVPKCGDEEEVAGTIEAAEEIVRRLALDEFGEVL
jgi:hypothetical protein